MNPQILSSIQYADKLAKIEKEILILKKGGVLKYSQTPISLKGILKGIKVTEKDIQQAKKSLFRKIKV